MGKKIVKKRRRGANIRALLIIIILPVAVIVAALLFTKGADKGLDDDRLQSPKSVEVPIWVDVQLIDIDGASRRGDKLEGVKDIVIHYVANPGTSAQQNRNFFNNSDSEVSSHFVIGIDGEIIQCVPLDEISSASNWRNIDTISIEVCHPDESGKFTDKSYKSLIKLAAWLCDTYDLGKDDLIRHYDVTQKKCPLYYVDNESAWIQMKDDIAAQFSTETV